MAKAAAKQDHSVLFTSLCSAEPTGPGTAFNFPSTPENFKAYTASAVRFGDIAAKAGADVLISNHSQYDGSQTKIPALKLRKPGEPNSYVVGNDSVKRYLKVAEECSRAWEIRTAK